MKRAGLFVVTSLLNSLQAVRTFAFYPTTQNACPTFIRVKKLVIHRFNVFFVEFNTLVILTFLTYISLKHTIIITYPHERIEG